MVDFHVICLQNRCLPVSLNFQEPKTLNCKRPDLISLVMAEWSDSKKTCFFFLIGIQSSKPHRYTRDVDSTKKATKAKDTAEAMLKINKLLSEGRLHLCESKGVTCLSVPPGPPGPPGPKGHEGDRGLRGQKGRTGSRGVKGIMGVIGPAGPKGETGTKGQKGYRGPAGMPGPKGDLGPAGPPGKQGIMGSPGLKGETGIKGEKGDIGPAGMPGAKGEPGESISSPAVVVSPLTLTVNEGGSASFQCSASGYPEPAVMWRKLDNQSEITQTAVSGEKLQLKNVTGNDSGEYQCSATNILGNSQEVVRLAVNGKVLVILIIHTTEKRKARNNNR